MTAPRPTGDQNPLIRVESLRKWFPARHRGGAPVLAVTDVSFNLYRGEVLGLVGESGSGKSTVGMSLMRLHRPDTGRIELDGVDIAQLSERQLRPHRRKLQMVFQDPSSSLNPRMRVGDVLAEPLNIHGIGRAGQERRDRVNELLGLIGLSPAFAGRFPHQMSGGQKQRIGIARALAVEPSALIADESVSALDVSVQAQIIDLLLDLRQRLDLTMLFISHDMSVVEYVSDRVAVLYLGRLLEIGPTREIFSDPRHPYTEALLSAVPAHRRAARRKRISLVGDLPNPSAPPSGCVFWTRCPYAKQDCAATVPALVPVGPARASACLRPELYGAPRPGEVASA